MSAEFHPCEECGTKTKLPQLCVWCWAAKKRTPGNGPIVTPDDVKWIVNDLGELGVEVFGRCFFLYKGNSLEYQSGLNDDDQTPIRYRRVGKREFGETQWPEKWIREGRREDLYTEECVYTPGLSDGPPNNPDYQWKPLPPAPRNPADDS